MENFLFGIAMLRQADLWLSQLSQAGYVSCRCQLSLPIDGSSTWEGPGRALGRAQIPAASVCRALAPRGSS